MTSDTTKPDKAPTETDPVFKVPSTYGAVFSDFYKGAKHWRIWTTLAWHGIRLRYKRSWIGIGWVALSFALFAMVKILIFGPLANNSLEYYAAYLAMGYLSWRLISNFIVGGASVYTGSQSWIKSEPVPLSLYLYKLMVNNFIIFIFQIIPAVAICIFFERFNPAAIFSVPAVFLIFAINGMWVSNLMGIICTRYRDVMYFLVTVMQVLYFATPILWVPPETGYRMLVAKYNPFTYYIDLIREPVLEGTVPWHSWKLVGIFTVGGIIISFITFAHSRKRLVFWL